MLNPLFTHAPREAVTVTETLANGDSEPRVRLSFWRRQFRGPRTLGQRLFDLLFGVFFPLAALYWQYSLSWLHVFPCALLIAIIWGPPRPFHAGLFSAFADFVVFVGAMVMLICTAGACLALAATILRLFQFHVALVEHSLHVIVPAKALALYNLYSQQRIVVWGTLLVTFCMLFCTLAYFRNSLLFAPHKLIEDEHEAVEDEVQDLDQNHD